MCRLIISFKKSECQISSVLFYPLGRAGGDRRTLRVRQVHAPVDHGGTEAAHAQALGEHPAILHADEPTGNLDSTSGASITDLIREHNLARLEHALPLQRMLRGATITGVEVRLNARLDSTSGAPKICLDLSWDGGTTWTAAKSTGTPATVEGSYTVGGAAGTWGRAWSPGDVSDANLRVRLTNVTSNTSRDFSLDRVAVQVRYQP